MSDDLVNRLGFHGFNGSENVLHRTRRWTVERLEAKARIEELEAQVQSMALDCLAAHGQAGDAHKAQLDAEAKLAKAEAFAIGTILYAGNTMDDYLADKARDALAEIKGETS